MTPEAAGYLEKARDYLGKARDWLDALHRGDEAARSAYLAGFHAAQALIFERTGTVAKTHRGVRSSFAQLVREDGRFDRTLTQFLARGYGRKEVVDYGVGPDAIITEAEAEELLSLAVVFVDRVAQTLG